MQLTPSMQTFILHWGDMGSSWGLNRSVAQIHALLHLSPDPLTAEEIATTLNLARSNISTGLKELSAWNLVQTSRKLGDRREYYVAIGGIYDLVDAVIAARRDREFLPTLTALRDIQASAETDKTPPQVQARLAETVEAMQQLDGWYQSIAALPRQTQLTLLKMGAKLSDAIAAVTTPEPKDKKKKKKKKKKKDAPEEA